MDTNHQKELFSIAYIHAVAAVAGLAISRPFPDQDSVDISLAWQGKNGIRRSPQLDLQVKATSRDLIRNDGYIHYPLSIKNYNDLRPDNFLVPRLLTVMIVPDNIEDWVTISDEHMIMRHCAYWLSLRRMPEIEQKTNVVVKIPLLHKFDVTGLKTMMSQIAKEQFP